MINEARTPWTEVLGQLREGRTVQAKFGSELAKAKVSDTANALLTDGPLSDYFVKLGAIREALGDNLVTNMASQGLIRDTGILANVNQFITASGQRAAIQRTDPSPYGSVTFQGNVDAAKQRANIPEATTASRALEHVTIITNTEAKDSAKLGVAEYFFHPNNAGKLARFDEGSRVKIWNSLTSGTVSKEMARVEQGDQEVAAWRRNWVTATFSNELFGKDVKDFAALQLPVGASIAYKSDKSSSEFRLMFKGQDITDRKLVTGPTHLYGKEAPGGGVYVDAQTKQSAPVIQRMNQGIQGLVNYSSTKGGTQANVDAFVLDTMMNLGYNPIAGVPTSFPEHISKALYLTVRGDALKKALETK